MGRVPWLRILDAILGVTDLARGPRSRLSPEADQQLAAGGAFGHLETRLAGVVVAALKEAFDRDTRRLELEREQMEAERARAERALRLELLRQAADREIGRLRLMAGVAAATWLGTLLVPSRLIGGGAGARTALGIGWALLIAALASAFAAQTRVARALDRLDAPGDAVAGGTAGMAAPWLIVAGLAVIAMAMLIA